MNTNNTSRDSRKGNHNVVRGNTYASQKWQPRNIFCMGDSLIDKLDEFLWNREHEQLASRKVQPAGGISAVIETVKSAQKAKRAGALNIGGF